MSNNNDSETLSNNNTKKEVQKVLPEENILLNNETIDIIGMGCDDETCHFKPLKFAKLTQLNSPKKGNSFYTI